jgi:hypothetical protein
VTKKPASPLLALALLLAAAAAGCGSSSSASAAPPILAGSEAKGFLEASPFSAMEIEVIPTTGRDPDPGALALFVQRATEHCRKPGGIALTLDGDVAPVNSGATRWTTDQLLAFQSANRKAKTSGDTIVLQVLYLDGSLASDSTALAVTVGPDLVAVFKDRVVATAPADESAAESSVLVHELGHVLGLVNQPDLMVTPHEDLQHPGHCNNRLCVMFWELEVHAPAGAVEPHGAEFPPLDYDDNCKADLRAAGGQ